VPIIMSHENPVGSQPETATKEQLSKAYVHMVASAAGVDMGTWGMDYDGFDVSLKSSVDYGPHGLLGPGLDIQLKCTGQKSVNQPDHVAWSLKRKTFNLLAAPNRSTPAVFCVMILPHDSPGYWLRHDDEGLLARSQMYFLRGSDFPAATKKKNQILHLPKENLFTPGNLLMLMEESSLWWATI
jgi:hypothetical protein